MRVRRTKLSLQVALRVWLFSPVACSCMSNASSDAMSGHTVRDSAGVWIVENATTVWSEGSGWKLGGQPELEIGGNIGDPSTEFGRITAALSLMGGTILIADLQAAELRFYDEGGNRILTIGGQGKGPGEFQGIAKVWLAGEDTIVAYDPWGSRISYFGLDGRFLESELIGVLEPSISHVLTARFPDGTFLARPNAILSDKILRGWSRDTVIWLRVGANGVVVDTVGRFPGYEGVVLGRGVTRTIAVRPFSPRGAVVLTAERLYSGDGDRYSIDVYDHHGTLLRRIRRIEAKPREITEADVEAAKKAELERATDDASRSAIERKYAAAGERRIFPAFRDFVIDAEGNVWVQSYPRPADREARWTVFDSVGRMLGDVRMPSRLNPTEIGRQHVLGVWRDELDVERVRLYALFR